MCPISITYMAHSPLPISPCTLVIPRFHRGSSFRSLHACFCFMLLAFTHTFVAVCISPSVSLPLTRLPRSVAVILSLSLSPSPSLSLSICASPSQSNCNSLLCSVNSRTLHSEGTPRGHFSLRFSLSLSHQSSLTPPQRGRYREGEGCS